MQDSKSLNLFSWGYWGWGSTTKQFVESADLAEKARGFNPPLFVDVRLDRSVRAPGFREGAFQRTMGDDRYVWMNGLGNKNVGTGGAWVLKEPKDVQKLLKLAEENSSLHRRVIYFCACEYPVRCHRSLITNNLLKLAKQHNRRIRLAEWPGTDLPEAPLRWNVPKAILSSVQRGRKNFELPTEVPLADAASVAWYTPVVLVSGDTQLPILAGPAVVQKDRWMVQVLEGPLEPDASNRDMLRLATRNRAAFGYSAHQA